MSKKAKCKNHTKGKPIRDIDYILNNISVEDNKFKYNDTIIIEVNKYTTIGTIDCKDTLLNIPLTVNTTKKSYNISINTKDYQ